MKNLNKNQRIAVGASLVFLAYLLFAGPIMSLFSTSENNLNNQMIQTGFVTEDVNPGSGLVAEHGDVVIVNYVGTFPDGKVFDSSIDRGVPFTFTLGAGEVIRGWDEGLVGMKVGSKRIITIAPDYAYGETGVGTIPPNSTLIFEVNLLNVKKPASR